VRVLKLATKTERTPDSTGMPACTRSPPKTSAVPSDGRRTFSGGPSGYSGALILVYDLKARDPSLALGPKAGAPRQ
jgi:hypothetical protein